MYTQTLSGIQWNFQKGHLVCYRVAGNIGGHYIWRKSHKLDLNNVGEILIWCLSVAVHIGEHALYDQ